MSVAGAKTSAATRKAAKALEAFARGYPQTTVDHPWGELAVKVKKKGFVFMRADENGLSLSCKLPLSSEAALMFHFAEPTGYGLGRSGWVTATFGPREAPPLDLLELWIDESYRAVAPAALVKSVPAIGRPGAQTRKRRHRSRAR